ncbi:MAG: hypothetical protein CL489_10890 [Acidobacteria bacterium]|nr:hypothetical protein [Acidobacteriota bacterium]
MDKTNVNRVLKLAMEDPDISDFSSFESYVSKNSDLKPLTKSKTDKNNFKSFSVGDEGDIRGQTVRPGFGSSLVNGRDKLRNRVHELENEFEVYNTDNIPLSTYQKMSVDPMIRLATNLIVGLISGLKFTIAHPDEKVQAVVNDIYKIHHNSTVRNMLTSGLKYGFSFGEKVWQREEITSTSEAKGEKNVVYSGKVASLKKVKWLDPRQNFEFYVNKSDEISKVVQVQNSTRVAVKRDKIVWFILDREFSSVFGKSRYKSAYIDWYYSKIARQYMLKHLEKTGSPHLEVRYPLGENLLDGQMVSNDQIAQRMAQSLLVHGSVMVPSEVDETSKEPRWSLEYKEPKNTSLDAYMDYLQLADRRKVQAHGIPDSILVGDSNFSETDAKTDLLLIMAEDLVDQLEESIKTDLIDVIAAYNFGPKIINDLVFTIDRSGLGRRKAIKEFMTAMLRVGTAMKGRKMTFWPDIRKGFKDLGIPTTTFDELFVEDELETKRQEDLMKAKEKQDAGNDKDRNRPGGDNRSRTRDAKDDSATDNN